MNEDSHNKSRILECIPVVQWDLAIFVYDRLNVYLSFAINVSQTINLQVNRRAIPLMHTQTKQNCLLTKFWNYVCVSETEQNCIGLYSQSHLVSSSLGDHNNLLQQGWKVPSALRGSILSIPRANMQMLAWLVPLCWYEINFYKNK